MELGYNNPNGISFFELKESVENSLGIQINEQTEYAFIVWFLNNFSTINLNKQHYIEHDLDKIRIYLIGDSEDRLYPFGEKIYKTTLNNKFYIKGETLKQYIDYKELIHAKKSANSAFILSIISIFIALISLYITYSSLSPDPVFEIVIKKNPKDSIAKTSNQIIVDRKYIDSVQIIKITDSVN